MELTLTPEETAFQHEVRDFIEEKYPSDIRDKIELGQRLDKDDYVRWQKILNDRGWIAPGWPAELGGTGWTPMQKHLFEEELAEADTPRIMPFGLVMVAPVIMAFGNDEQKQKYLPRILSSQDWWCQGYSEPGSGSDLASLQTKAVRDGDHYIVNGQKTWTTLAQYADMMFTLVRTSSEGKPQQGISFLLIDMNSPGVSVDPIVTIDGGREVNSVFLEDVRVPVENRIGEENKGWTYAKFLLGHERTSIAATGRSKKLLKRLKEIASEEIGDDGAPLDQDTGFMSRVADVEIRLLALESVVLRVLYAEQAGAAPGPDASLLKIEGTLIQQDLTELAREAVGNYAFPFIPEAFDPLWNEDRVGPDYAAPLAPVYFNWRKASIYGGSNEVQRGIISKHVLGL